MKVWSLSMSKSKYPVYMHFIFFFRNWSGFHWKRFHLPYQVRHCWQDPDRLDTESRYANELHMHLLFIINYLLFNTHCKYIQRIFAGGCVCLSRRKRSLQQWTGVVKNSCRHHFSVTDTNACCPFVLYPPVPVWSALCWSHYFPEN